MDKKAEVPNGTGPTDMDVTNEELEDCGIRSCRPGGLQKFKNLLSFSITFGMTALIMQTINIYITSQITAVQKQYGLSSTTIAIVLSCNDIGFLSTVLFLCHFGGRGHIPRILSVASLLFGISGIISGICYFINPIYLPESGTVTLTNTTNTTDFSRLCIPGVTPQNPVCSEDKKSATDDGKNEWVLWILGLSMVIQGAGKSPRVALSSTYIDNNAVDKTRTSFYMGIVMTMMLFGPAIATLVGGAFRTLPVDLGNTSLTPDHPDWIGCWWLGFLVFGVAAILISIPVMMFPRRMISDNNNTKKIVEEERTLLQKIKSLPVSLLRILRKPVYTFTLFAIVPITFSTGAEVSFGLKYIEHQFMVPGYQVNILFGAQRIAGAALGTFIGGVLTSRLRLTIPGCLRFIILVKCIAIAIRCLHFWFGCDNPEIIGFNTDDSKSVIDNGLTRCDCSKTTFYPVCATNQTYYSPCFAGCQNYTDDGFGACAMLQGGTTTTGMCPTDCPFLYYYVAVDLVSGLVGTMAILPAITTLIRSVSPADKAIAVALMTFLNSLLGFLPGPILFGGLIDSTCLEWKETCGKRGECLLYDIVSQRYKLKGVLLACYLLSVLLQSFSLFFAVRQEKNKSKEKEALENSPNDPEVEMTRL